MSDRHWRRTALTSREKRKVGRSGGFRILEDSFLAIDAFILLRCDNRGSSGNKKTKRQCSHVTVE